MRRKYYRTLSFIISMVLLISFSGCAPKPTPAEVVSEFLDAVKVQDFEKMGELYSGEAEQFNMGAIASDDGEAPDILIEKFKDFEYEIESEDIDGEKATVSATIRTYDFPEIFKAILIDLLEEAFSSVTSSDSGTLEEATLRVYEKHLNAAKKDKSTRVEIHLTETKEGWKLDGPMESEELLDALVGGLLNFDIYEE